MATAYPTWVLRGTASDVDLERWHPGSSISREPVPSERCKHVVTFRYPRWRSVVDVAKPVAEVRIIVALRYTCARFRHERNTVQAKNTSREII